MEESKEKQPEQQRQNPLKNNRIYKLLIWENILYSLIAFKILNTFFYVHVVWGHSLINLFIKTLIGFTIYNIVIRLLQNQIINEKEGHRYNYDLIGEDAIKELYVVIYVGINKAIQYVRDIIEMKDQKRSLIVSFYRIYFNIIENICIL